jgi:hypothetical protein
MHDNKAHKRTKRPDLACFLAGRRNLWALKLWVSLLSWMLSAKILQTSIVASIQLSWSPEKRMLAYQIQPYMHNDHLNSKIANFSDALYWNINTYVEFRMLWTPRQPVAQHHKATSLQCTVCLPENNAWEIGKRRGRIFNHLMPMSPSWM